MSVFDENVRKVLTYCGGVSDKGIKHDLLVALVKTKAYYSGFDLFKSFYAHPYDDGCLNEEKEACFYLSLVPLLQKLFNVAWANGKKDKVRLGGKPLYDDIEKIKRKIENI